jgi:predicted aldo/keto reductase-like oxidoreductase
MKKLRLGKTNLMVSEVGFGGIPLARVSKEKASKTLLRAIELGINFIDTANAYKDSEFKIGQTIKGVRDELILATKSTRRQKKELLGHIDNSLKMLQTDRIDLFQIHQVSGHDELKKVFDPGGALEGALEAKQAGKILHIGITSHRLETAIELVQSEYFETIQFTANFVETESIEQLFPQADKLDIGCIVMKPLGGGVLENAGVCFRFLQQYPHYIPIPGMSEIEEVEEIVALYENKTPLTDEDIKTMDEIKQKVGTQFCRRCGYCEPCPHGVKIFAGMAIQRVLTNYGKHYDAPWFLEGINSIENCTNCGCCENLCPYNLAIRQTLKENKAFYNKMMGIQ